jgi:predicted permease
MKSPMQVFRQLRYLLRLRRNEEGLAEELAFHREMAEREGNAIPLGNELRIREETRDASGAAPFERMAQDLRFAFRMLAKDPGFAVPAVLMLALGIGVNVAVFGFFSLVYLRPLPVREPDSLIRLSRQSPERYAYTLPYAEFAFLREHSRTAHGFVAMRQVRLATDDGLPALQAQYVSENFFEELGAPIARSEGAVISYSFWQRRFDGEAGVAGKPLRVNGKLVPITAVAAKGFPGLSMEPPDVWLPMDKPADDAEVQVWARVAQDGSPAAVEAEMRGLALNFRRVRPELGWEQEWIRAQAGGHAASLVRGTRSGTGPETADGSNAVLLLVASLGGLILLVACTNLGGLLLARGVSRERELRIRASVGAGSGRLAAQLFTESLALAALGALAGLGLGYGVSVGLMRYADLPAWLDPAPDWRVVLFACGAGLASALLFGLAPAMQGSKMKFHAGMARKVLIGAQVAASCVLLIVSGLLARSIQQATDVPPGFDYEQMAVVSPGLAERGFDASRAGEYLRRLEERARAVAGVESTALTDTSPMGRSSTVMQVDLGSGKPLEVLLNHVRGDYVKTMGLRMPRGREPRRAREAAISELAARRLYGDGDPIGKPLAIGGGYTVTGVTGQARLVRVEDGELAQAYLFAEEADMAKMMLIVRASTALETVLPELPPAARAVEGSVIPEVQAMRTAYEKKLEGPRRGAVAVSALGLAALVLACGGIVGLVAFAVARRTREIGVRMALGARPVHVLGNVLGEFARPVLAGLVAGVAAAATLSQLLQRQLYGISHLDGMAYGGAIGVFVATAGIAALVPAWRALRVDPAQALRGD